MQYPDHAALTTLARPHGWPSITLYAPTHRAGSQKEQDRIRLKNLLREACDALVAEGMRTADADRFCSPIAELVADDSFWRQTADGLAVFVSEDLVQTIVLEKTVPEQSVIGDRFYLRPLLAAHTGDRRFFALAVDRNGCRLFAGDGATIERLPLEDAPVSLADELRYDETQDAVQYSSMPAPQSAAGGKRPTAAIFHGHGGEKDTDKINLERYLRKVEAVVSRSAACTSDAPLVLLGVEYELASYRSLSTCPSLVPQAVFGATDELTEYEIHTRALEALEPRFAEADTAALRELTEKRGSSAVTDDVTEIVAAAATGRVKMLFFDDSAGPFGTFDREGFDVEVLGVDPPPHLRERMAGSSAVATQYGWDLVDLAAAETLLHDGEVHAVSSESETVRGVAAVLRY